MGSAAGHGIITMFTIRNTVTKIQTGIGRGPGLYTLLERGTLGDCNRVSLHGARRWDSQSKIFDDAMPQSVWMEAQSETMLKIRGSRVLG